MKRRKDNLFFRFRDCSDVLLTDSCRFVVSMKGIHTQLCCKQEQSASFEGTQIYIGLKTAVLKYSWCVCHLNIQCAPMHSLYHSQFLYHQNNDADVCLLITHFMFVLMVCGSKEMLLLNLWVYENIKLEYKIVIDNDNVH